MLFWLIAKGNILCVFTEKYIIILPLPFYRLHQALLHQGLIIPSPCPASSNVTAISHSISSLLLLATMLNLTYVLTMVTMNWLIIGD